MKITRILPLLLVCGCSASVTTTGPVLTAVPVASSVPSRPVPPLNAWEWVNGSEPSLSGKPAIIEFWATWCQPCLRATPHVVELSRKYKKQGLVTAGIHVQRGIDQEKIDGFISAFAVPYPIGLDRQDTVRKAFSVGPIPRAFVVSHTGDIVWDGNPLSSPDEFDRMVEQVVKDAAAK